MTTKLTNPITIQVGEADEIEEEEEDVEFNKDDEDEDEDDGYKKVKRLSITSLLKVENDLENETKTSKRLSATPNFRRRRISNNADEASEQKRQRAWLELCQKRGAVKCVDENDGENVRQVWQEFVSETQRLVADVDDLEQVLDAASGGDLMLHLGLDEHCIVERNRNRNRNDDDDVDVLPNEMCGAMTSPFRKAMFGSIPVLLKRVCAMDDVGDESGRGARYELAIHSLLRNDHVLRCYGAVGRDCLVFERCEQSVAQLVARQRGAVSIGRVCQIGLEIARALAYMRRHDIVHGNLSSSCVLLDRDGHVRLAGFSKSEHREARWHCPESVASRHAQATDIYALGLILLHLTSGRLPFEVECRRWGTSQLLAYVDAGGRAEASVKLPKNLRDIISNCCSASVTPSKLCDLFEYMLDFLYGDDDDDDDDDFDDDDDDDDDTGNDASAAAIVTAAAVELAKSGTHGLLVDADQRAECVASSRWALLRGRTARRGRPVALVKHLVASPARAAQGMWAALAGRSHRHVAKLCSVSVESSVGVALALADAHMLDVRAESTLRHRIAVQLASAVAFLHSHNVVHRALHSGNVLLCGNDANVALIDASRCATLGGDGDKDDLRFDVIACAGMPLDAVAPELLLAYHRPYSTASDVYALAALLHRVLTGRSVAPHLAPADFLALLPHHFTSSSPLLPAPVRELLNECLHPDIERRPSSQHVADELSHHYSIAIDQDEEELVDDDQDDQELADDEQDVEEEIVAAVQPRQRRDHGFLGSLCSPWLFMLTISLAFVLSYMGTSNSEARKT
jgi:serine/threonine protein kinase